MGIMPDSILGQAVNAVTSQMSQLQNMGSQYRTQFDEALAKIGSIEVDGPGSVPRPPTPTVELPDFSSSSPPSFGGIGGITIPSPPDMSAISELVIGLDVGDMAEPPPFDVPFGVNVPDAPAMAVISAPARPSVDTSIVIPDAPTIEIPEMEALTAITLPTFEFPELPNFDNAPPDPAAITVPNVFINWVEPAYASELLDDIQAQVKTMMSGGTGLPAAIEDALFSRARERDSAESARALQEAVDGWAARGFTMPPGMLAKQADVIREQSRVRAAELNRDIMIEAAKWEIESVRFAVQQGMALEQLTSNLHENTVKRIFEAARFQAESEISVFNARIGLFNAQNAAFATVAEVYRTKLQAAISKLTAYKTAVEGQVALGEINQQRVEVFKAKLGAVQTHVEVYKAMVSGAQVRADTIKTQFDAYRADVQAFAEQIGAEKVKFDAYESQVKAEAAKAGVIDSLARAHAATIQGLASQAQAKTSGVQAKAAVAQALVAQAQVALSASKAQADATVAQATAATQAYVAEVRAWEAQANADAAKAETMSRYADMQMRTNIAYSEAQIAAFSASASNAVQRAQVSLEAAKAMGQYTAQLAAGAMSAAHVSASISGSGSASSTDSRTTSNSTNHNYNY